MAIRFLNDIESSGEIQGTSLDINGNADISGNLSGVDLLTAQYGRFTSTGDASVGGTTHAFQAGTTASTNIIIDNNEIMARSNGAVAVLNLNPDGGNVTFHNNGNASTIDASGNATFAGEVQGTSLDINGAGDVSGALNVGGSLTATGGGISGNLYANRYLQSATGIPTSNLGSPTVTEMALFDNQFGPKTTLANGYDDLSDLTFWSQATSGASWVEVTSYSDDNKRKFLRTNNSGVIIPNGIYAFRVEFVGKGYTFANAMTAYWSSNSHNTQAHVWKRRCSDDVWIQHTSSSATVSSWPGHLYLPFSTIPWYETNTTSASHYQSVRIEFTPNWATSGNYQSTNINLSGMQIWGGYPSGKRTVHSYDQNGKLNLFGDINVPGTLTVGAEIEATQLDINGSADILTDLAIGGDLTVTGKITQAGVIDREEWGRTYTVNTNSPLPLLTDGGAALPTGGAYRMTGHISGTGSDQVACAVFWNENGTWYINKTFEGGTSSNHVEFKILNSVPTVTLESHASNYNVHVAHERLSLDEATGTDNLRGYFGSDSYLSWLETTNTLTVPGDVTVSGGDLILGGTGRIQGVDTVSSGTDATNKTYVDTKMPKSGGAFTGAVTTNSTIDGRDVAADGVLATNALPKGGGTMSGAIAMGGNNITGGGTLTGTTFSGDLNGTINTATTAATQTAGNNSTKVATTAYADAAVAALVDSAPANLNTLNELAEALNDDDDAIVTINTALGTKLPLAGGTMTGQLTTTLNQITTNIGTTSAIRLKPGATTNETGKSSIFLGTSPLDNYGISLRGARLGVNGAPTFEVATHAGSANGTVALSINNSNNVGIGTSSPIAPLHIATTNTDTDNGLGDLNNPRAGILINNLSTAANTYASLDFRAGTHDARIALTNGGSNIGNMNFIVDNGNSPIVGMALTSVGNVTVAGEVEAASLDINGNAAIDGTTTITSTSASALQVNGGTGVSTTGAFVLRQNGSGEGNGMSITSGYAVSHRLWKDSSGNFNIGSSSNSNAFKQDTTGNVTIEGTIGSGAITSTGKITNAIASTHVSGNITAANAHLDLYNNWESDTDQKGSIITFTDNYYSGSAYNKTTRAAIKGGTDTVGNTANGYLEFYTDSSSANSPTLALRLDKDQNAAFAGELTIPGYINHAGDSGTKFGFEGNDAFRIYTASTSQLQIDSAGAATFAGKVITTELESAGALLLDAAADITIDAGGGDIILSDDATIFGTISSSGGMQIRSRVNNADMLFRGVDNGTEFTALTLDMSENGNATFAGTIGSGAITSTGTITAATSFIADAVSSSNNDPGTDNVQFSGYGLIGNRGNLYITNASTSSSAVVQIGVGGTHNASPKLTIGTTGVTSTGTITGTTLTGTSLDINGAAAITGALTVGVNDAGHDVVFYGNTANKKVMWDTSVDHLKLYDDTRIVFGTGVAAADYDGSIYWNQTDLVIDSESDLQILSDAIVTGDVTATGLDINGNADISGSITNATWAGDVIPSNKLDTDTAHLSGAQSFTGQKTFSAGIVPSFVKHSISGSTSADYGPGAEILFGISNESTTAGAIYVLKSGVWTLMNADTPSDCQSLTAVAVGGNSGQDGMLIRGCITLGNAYVAGTDAEGIRVFASTTDGKATLTAPSSSGDTVRVLGYSLNSGSKKMFFTPDNTHVEIA